MSFFIEVALTLQTNGNQAVIDTQTFEYHGVTVVIWTLSKNHAMVIVRRKQTNLEYKYFKIPAKVIANWLINDQLFMLHQYRRTPGDHQFNQDELENS